MSTISTWISGRILLRALTALACSGCVDADPAELGIYDQPVQGSQAKPPRNETKRKPDAAAPASPLPTARDAAAPANPPATVDAAAPVEVDAKVEAPAPAEKPGLSFSLPAQPDPELRCFPLLARSATDANQPYTVPKIEDLYMNFTFDAPFQGTQFVRSVRPVLSQTTVIHRFRLFQNGSASAAGASESDRMHTGASLLATWAPNGDPVSFAPNTGMRVRGDVSYTLEVHYRNMTGAPFPDRSGVELCVTAREPKFLVGLAQLAGRTAQANTLSGICTPSASEPVHVLGLQPQLDPRIQHIEATVRHSAGTTLVALDERRMFDIQPSSGADFELGPGDTLTTTCTRRSENDPGVHVIEPACNLYVFHTPAHALTDSGAESSVDGIDTCLR